MACFLSTRVSIVCVAARPSEAWGAGPAPVPRVPGPRGLAGPFHQVARVHADPRILEEARERV